MVVCMHYCATAVIEQHGSDGDPSSNRLRQSSVDAGVLGGRIAKPFLGADRHGDSRW